MSKFKKMIISITAILMMVAVIIFALITINTNNKYTQRVKQIDSFFAIGKYSEATIICKQALEIDL